MVELSGYTSSVGTLESEDMSEEFLSSGMDKEEEMERNSPVKRRRKWESQ